MKVIQVCGVGNSGKSTSVRLFLENQEVFFPQRPRDILLILPIQRNGRTYRVGIGSGGDSLQIVQNNFSFFHNYYCDIVVQTSKSRGQTFDYVQAIGQNPGNQLVQIQTNRVYPYNVSNVQAKNAHVANQIFQSIP